MSRCQLFIAMQLLTALGAWCVDDVTTWVRANDLRVVCVDFKQPLRVAWVMVHSEGFAVGTRRSDGSYSRRDTDWPWKQQ